MSANVKLDKVSNDETTLIIEFEGHIIIWHAIAEVVPFKGKAITKDGPILENGHQTEIVGDGFARTINAKPLIDLFIQSFTDAENNQEGFEMLKEKLGSNFDEVVILSQFANDLQDKMLSKKFLK